MAKAGVKRAPSGSGLQIVRRDAWIPDELAYRIRQWSPGSQLGKIIQECFKWLPAELASDLLERITSCVVLESSLAIKVVRHPDSPARRGGPLVEEHGIVSRKVVATAGVTRMTVDWANGTFDMKHMGLGTSSAVEAVGNVGMTAEITDTHYAGSVRPTCTHVEAGVTVPIVGTHTQTTAGDAIEEHGIFNSATQGAVTLWDRSLTGTQTLAVADSLVGTYIITLTAGG